MAHVHFIGIGGSGLSAIARLHLERGYMVTGSDRALSPLAADLQKAGATVYLGHAAGNVTGADWVVRSSAIPDDNPEVLAALGRGIPVYKRADYLGRLMASPDKIGIAIAGTHGKTTTSAMLAWTLSRLGQDPSFIVGGVLSNLGVNAHDGKGPAFVIEADEYDRMFLGLKPRFAVVTNVEHDHPDCYPTPADFQAAFVDFVKLIPADGALVACGEDAGAIELMAEARRMDKRVIAYRIAEDSPAQAGEWALAQNPVSNPFGGFTFNVTMRLQTAPQHISNVQLQAPGLHNVRNALAALTVIALMGLPLKEAAEALGEFRGADRRFEVKGQANPSTGSHRPDVPSGGQAITVIDDYAHHPTEIRATLAAARARYPASRIWAVWQPHTYSRTHALFDEFAASFEKADEVIVSEIYAAREPKEDFSAEKVVQAMRRPSAHFIAELAEISNYLVSQLKSGDVLIVLSAGDADRVSAEVLTRLKEGENHE
jgi:UDP-N-acetylmuramate--alanine ligase